MGAFSRLFTAGLPMEEAMRSGERDDLRRAGEAERRRLEGGVMQQEPLALLTRESQSTQNKSVSQSV